MYSLFCTVWQDMPNVNAVRGHSGGLRDISLGPVCSAVCRALAARTEDDDIGVRKAAHSQNCINRLI